MLKKRRLAGGFAAILAVVAAMAVPAVSSAHTGEFAKFNYCPSSNTEVRKCLYSVTAGGYVQLGNKKVPIVNPVVLQGGYGKADPETFMAKFYAATNGETLSKAAQPVPGGLTGLVNCKEISNFFLRIACEATLENGFTGVNSTLELALPASEIQISERHQLFEEGTALRLPVKVHLENPLLGSSCYIGSSSNPIWWNLTTGTTSPPSPAKPISGAVGEGTIIEEEQIIKYTGVKLVDNAWSAPGASGCGGPGVELLLDPILNLSVGVPAAGGKNAAIQENVTIYNSPTATVNAH
jgi:hypothetical protein